MMDFWARRETISDPFSVLKAATRQRTRQFVWELLLPFSDFSFHSLAVVAPLYKTTFSCSESPRFGPYSVKVPEAEPSFPMLTLKLYLRPIRRMFPPKSGLNPTNLVIVLAINQRPEVYHTS